VAKPPLTTDQKQIMYRDARVTGEYDSIWQSVNKCVYCDLREKYIFYEEHGIVMTINLYAYIDGHFLIVPRRHVRSAKELSELEWDTIRKFSYIAKRLIRKVHGVRGMQLVQKDGADAQSTVEHLHFHCIPFDAPDLCEWNYRRLAKTPLENVADYKSARKTIVKTAHKFEEKYANHSGLPIYCDAIITRPDGKILLEERTPEYALVPDMMTLPGGKVTDFSKALTDELSREVQEETNISIDGSAFRLVASNVTVVTRMVRSAQLNVRRNVTEQLLLNTYSVALDSSPSNTKPGDDCRELVWLTPGEVLASSRVFDTTKSALAKVVNK
jgi:histidine triad (HIT) family protein